MQWYLTVIKKYAVVDGRARRKEYWMFVLFNIIFFFLLTMIDLMVGTLVLSSIYSLAMLVPNLTSAVRRLHDTGRSGWWLLATMVPLLGLVVFYFMVCESDPKDNQYGCDPKELERLSA
ncbi:DUF805 domain-containing protein [Vibrio ostreicida]|uniref:DUF805 domain-containing protein n=1 Tax=Vibrio ostreicida TaxID=526588 RepID=UPI003B59BA38